jgi:hypothetical protein
MSLRVTFAVPYSENGSQGDTFRNHGGHQIECDGRTLEDSKKKPSGGASNNGRIGEASVCVRAQGSYFVCD